jgi:hypothetical protein
VSQILHELNARLVGIAMANLKEQRLEGFEREFEDLVWEQ